MHTMEKTTTRSLLLDKGIILQSGAICQDKINLISGAMTAPLIETIWVFCDHDAEAMRRISATFAHLYHEGHEAEMMAILHILYDVSGLQFPKDVELLAGHSDAQQYFLFSFLLDMEECMQDFMSEVTEDWKIKRQWETNRKRLIAQLYNSSFTFILTKCIMYVWKWKTVVYGFVW